MFGMSDTSPEVETLMREMMMARSGEERLLMGSAMFDAARDMVIASLPENLPVLEFKRRLFERLYGFSLEQALQVKDSAGAKQAETSRT
jgi:hypothetical protein